MKKKSNDTLKSKNLDFESIVEEGIKLDEPDRTKYFETLTNNSYQPAEANRLSIILKRIKLIVRHVDGFVPEENTKYQNEILRAFYHKLDDKYLIEYLRDQKRRLDGLCADLKKEMDSLPMYESGPMSRSRYAQLHGPLVYNSRLSDWLTEIVARLTQEKSYWIKTHEKKIKVTNEIVAGFCKLVNDSALPYQKPEGEGAEKFCLMICELYKLPYKTRVRIAYSQPISLELAKKIEMAILPMIPAPDREEIQKLIDTFSSHK